MSASTSAPTLLPPYARRSPKVSEVLPILYLRSLSTGDFVPALADFFGTDAGLSASTISRLTVAWEAEHERWMERDPSEPSTTSTGGPMASISASVSRRTASARLVIIGVRPDGTKELVALADGYRESTESWAELLRDLRSRGLTAPVLATADGVLGLWAALRDVFPETAEQRCWVHKTVRVLDALPKRKHADAKAALVAISTAPSRAEALDAVTRFSEAFAEWPRAMAKVTDELDVLLAFLDYPLRAPCPPADQRIRSSRPSRRCACGPGSPRVPAPRAAGLAMAYKPVRAAEERWRRINAPHLVPLVRARATFIDGQPQERKEAATEDLVDQEDAAA